MARQLCHEPPTKGRWTPKKNHEFNLGYCRPRSRGFNGCRKGFYSNPYRFHSNRAIRNQLRNVTPDVVKQSTAPKKPGRSVCGKLRAAEDSRKRRGEPVRGCHINVLGLGQYIAQERLARALPRATIASVSVPGSFARQSGGQGRAPARLGRGGRQCLKQDQSFAKPTRLTRAGQNSSRPTVLLQPHASR